MDTKNHCRVMLKPLTLGKVSCLSPATQMEVEPSLIGQMIYHPYLTVKLPKACFDNIRHSHRPGFTSLGLQNGSLLAMLESYQGRTTHHLHAFSFVSHKTTGVNVARAIIKTLSMAQQLCLLTHGSSRQCNLYCCH